MNKQWNKDGLTRKKLENDFRIHEPFQVLEKNLSNLLARAFSKSSFLYHYQSLAILNEIKQTDTIGLLRRNVSDPVIQLFLPDGRNEA